MKSDSVRLAELCKEGPKTWNFLEVSLLSNLYKTFLFNFKSPLRQSLL